MNSSLITYTANDLLRELEERSFEVDVVRAPIVQDAEIYIKWTCPFCGTESTTDFDNYDNGPFEADCDNCDRMLEIEVG